MVQTTDEVEQYNFLRLYSAVFVLLKNEKIINNKTLECELNNYFCEEYKELFKNISYTNNRVNLSSGFIMAYNKGFLELVKPGQSLIQIDNDQSLEILTSYSDTKILLMTRLVTKMYSENSKNSKVMML